MWFIFIVRCYYDKEKHSYYYSYLDFTFFRKYMADNLLEFNMCHKLHVNSMVSDKAFKDYGKVRMFSAKNGVFFPFLQYGGISLLVVVCFGCVYEVVKKLMEM